MLLTNNDILELCHVSSQLELDSEQQSSIELLRQLHSDRIEISDSFYDMFLELLFSLKRIANSNSTIENQLA